MGDVKFEHYDGFTKQNRHEMPVIQYQDGSRRPSSRPSSRKSQGRVSVPRLEVRSSPEAYRPPADGRGHGMMLFLNRS